MSANFNDCLLILLVLACQVGLSAAGSKDCPTSTLNVYYSSEKDIFLAPGGNYTDNVKLTIDVIKISSLTLDYSKKNLLSPGWELPQCIFVHDINAKNSFKFKREKEQFAELVTDPITGNVYFISGNNGIGVCSLNTQRCVQLVEPDNDQRIKRRNLQLHPKSGLMYWVEDFHDTIVKRAGMDGRKIETFIPTDEFIYSIALDTNENQLYVALPAKIERKHIRSEKREHYLDVKAAQLYYYDCKLAIKVRDTKYFYVHSTADASLLIRETIHGHSFLMAVQSSGDVYQNPCQASDCAGVCVISPTTSQCMCGEYCTSVKEPTDDTPEEDSWYNHLSWSYALMSTILVALIVLIITWCIVRCQYSRVLSELKSMKVDKATKPIALNSYTDHLSVNGHNNQPPLSKYPDQQHLNNNGYSDRHSSYIDQSAF